MISHVNSVQEYNNLVEGKTVVVDFFATWCGPCRMLSPVIEQIDKEGLVKCDFVKVDVDELGELAAKYNVSSIPTLLVFKDGVLKETMLGYRPLPELVNSINKNIE